MNHNNDIDNENNVLPCNTRCVDSDNKTLPGSIQQSIIGAGKE